jgi:hypothetical protein
VSEARNYWQGLLTWFTVILIAIVLTLALLFFTIPSSLEYRRIKHYSEITGAIQTGYFTEDI